MAKLKKVIFGLFLAMFAVVALSSCNKDNDDTSVVSETVVAPLEEVVAQNLSSARNPFDKYILLNTTGYKHIIEEGTDYGKCGAMTFVAARHLKNSNHPLTRAEVNRVIKFVDDKNAERKPNEPKISLDVYQLYLYAGVNDAKLYRSKAGNRHWGKERDGLKRFIYEELSKGNPVVVSCLYNASTEVYGPNARHFYLIVGLALAHKATDTNYQYGGTGSYVLVKDVWRGKAGKTDEECYKTIAFDYSRFLSSIWYSGQRMPTNNGGKQREDVLPGSETYCAVAITK